MSAPTDVTRVDPMPVPEILALPAIVPIWPATAAALGGSPAGFSKNSTYSLAKSGELPVPVLRQGRRQKYVVRRADLLAYLGLNGDGASVAPETPPAEQHTDPTI